MAEFTPIMTQEDFDAAISERLKREQAKYSDYDTIKSDLGTLRVQLSAKDAEISTLQGKVKGYETDSVKTRIAKEIGLSSDAADFLQGETEEELKKSAEALQKILKPSAPPLRTSERAGDDDKDEALRETLRKLKGE